jgi:hypothetical protein
MPRPKGDIHLVLQDVLTLHGSQFRNACLIVASPPCQTFSYMAMPWSKAKAIEAEYRSGDRDVKKLTELFDSCFRIQREACEAAGRHIPLVVENVRGAQKWVGRSRWNFGSYHLWGDVPALMPMTKAFKSQGMNWSDRTKHGQDFTRVAGKQAMDGRKGSGGTWFDNYQAMKEACDDGSKGFGSGLLGKNQIARMSSSKSKARKAASAQIAKIPFELSTYIARVFKPT